MRALWTCVEAESGLQDLLTKLTNLRKQIPDQLESPFMDILDEFQAAEHRLQAVKHDLILCVRAKEEKNMTNNTTPQRCP